MASNQAFRDVDDMDAMRPAERRRFVEARSSLVVRTPAPLAVPIVPPKAGPSEPEHKAPGA